MTHRVYETETIIALTLIYRNQCTHSPILSFIIHLYLYTVNTFLSNIYRKEFIDKKVTRKKYLGTRFPVRLEISDSLLFA